MHLPGISVPHPLIVPIASRARPIIPRRRRVVIGRSVTVVRPIRISRAAPLRSTRRGIAPETDRVSRGRGDDGRTGKGGRRGKGNHHFAHQ